MGSSFSTKIKNGTKMPTHIHRRYKVPRLVTLFFLSVLTLYAVVYSSFHASLSNAFRGFQESDKLETAPQYKFKLTISIITYNRLQALQRLLSSLRRAHIVGPVNLRINVEAGAPNELLSYVDAFEWSHGEKFLNIRVKPAGLIPAVVESWYPADDNSYGLLLEDDLEVSPHFHEWLLSALALVQQLDMRDRVFGISLYTPRVIETVNPYRIFLPDVELPHAPAFLQQLPCSWGAAFFPSHWRKYVRYLRHRLTFNGSLIVPDSRTNGWTGSWKKYYIELAWAEALFMLYPNYKNQTSFSTNYVEQGAHVVAKDSLHTPAHYTVPLHEAPVKLRQDLTALPMLDVLGNQYHALEDSSDDAQEYCRRVSTGHTGVPLASTLQPQMQLGNKLVSGYALLPGHRLASIPEGESYYVGTMTVGGLFTIDHCFTSGPCTRVSQHGVESTRPNLALTIDASGKLTISSFGCKGADCKATWQSDGGAACPSYMLHLQNNGLLALHCGCGCHGEEPIWSFGSGSKQPVKCSTEDEMQPVLLPGSSLSSSRLNTLLSSKDSEGRYVEAVMQPDGNFVLYLNPSPTIHPVYSIPTNFPAESFSLDFALDGNLRIVGHKQQEHHSLWDNGFHSLLPIPYFLMVTHCGAVVVYEGYGACEHGQQVWSTSSDVGCSGIQPQCLDAATAQRQLMCGQSTPDVFSFLAYQRRFTVMLTTSGNNPAHLDRVIRHVSLHHLVSCILIVYLKPFEKEMRPFFINGKYVKYLHTYTGSLNDRFFPSVHVTTEAVLMLDEGVMVHHDDMSILFHHWSRYKRKLAGFFPLWVKQKNDTRVILGADEEHGSTGYALMSTRAVMLHKKYLYQYSCIMGQALRKIVDHSRNCEGIAMNFLASQATNGPSGVYIQPSHSIESPRLSAASSDSGVACLQRLERLLGYKLPPQERPPLLG